MFCLPLFWLVSCSDEPVDVQIIIEFYPENPEHSNQAVNFTRSEIMSGNVLLGVLNVSETDYRIGERNPSTGAFSGRHAYERYDNGEWIPITLKPNFAFVTGGLGKEIFEPGELVWINGFPLSAYDFRFVRGRYRAVFDDWYTEFTIA
jgi:hypothetical protein